MFLFFFPARVQLLILIFLLLYLTRILLPLLEVDGELLVFVEVEISHPEAEDKAESKPVLKNTGTFQT